MQVCTSLQTDNHASTQPLSFLQARMLFLPPNHQRQSTEGNRRNRTPPSIWQPDRFTANSSDIAEYGDADAENADEANVRRPKVSASRFGAARFLGNKHFGILAHARDCSGASFATY